MTNGETSASVAAWAEETFGPVADLRDLVARATEELDELATAIGGGESREAIVSEVADVAILLHRIAALCGDDLVAAIDRKMAINRDRVWRRSGNGTGRHVEATPSDD